MNTDFFYTFFCLFFYKVFMVMLYVIFLFFLILFVAFFTLFERKLMSSVQLRKGPDYTGFFGVLQPISDAFKLLFKEFMITKISYSLMFVISPVFVFFLSMLSWSFLPFHSNGSMFYTEYSLLCMLVISSVNAYFLFLSGFSSNSRYAFLGSLRSMAQLMSYEVSFAFLVMPIIFMSSSFNFSSIVNDQIYYGVSNIIFLYPNGFLFLIAILAETNSSPFDLPEAEAELVAGYNVEYSSMPFAYFFLGEYLNITTMSFIFSLIFLSGWSFESSIFFESFCMFFKTFFVIFFIVWVRATLPSVSYDFLMFFSWKFSLIWSSSFFLYFIFLYMFSIFLNY